MLMALMDKADNTKEQMDNVSREIKTKKKYTFDDNVRNQYHCNSSKECLWWPHQYTAQSWGVSELEDISMETQPIELQREKRMKNNRTQYPRMLGQLQKMWHTCN